MRSSRKWEAARDVPSITRDLVSIVTAGGTFSVSRPSRVLFIHSGFNRKFTNDTRVLLAIARTAGVNMILIPEDLPADRLSPVMNVVRDFISWSRKPAFLLVAVLRPDFVISDDTIYIAKNHLIDTENMMEKLLSKRLPWLSVKNDGVSEDPFTDQVQSRVDPDAVQGIFSSSIVFSNLGFKNFKDLLVAIDGSGIMA